MRRPASPRPVRCGEPGRQEPGIAAAAAPALLALPLASRSPSSTLLPLLLSFIARAVGNFGVEDWAIVGGVTAVSFPLGWLAGAQPSPAFAKVRRPGCLPAPLSCPHSSGASACVGPTQPLLPLPAPAACGCRVAAAAAAEPVVAPPSLLLAPQVAGAMARPSMWAGATMGLVAGFMIAYQNSCGRLMGLKASARAVGAGCVGILPLGAACCCRLLPAAACIARGR